MEDETKDVVSTSRRNFTRSIVTAAVAAPIVASMSACKTQPAPDSCSCPDHNGEPIKCSVVIPGLEVEPHEPPIGVSEGSLNLEMKPSFGTPGATGSAHRPYRYELTVPNYTEISKVQVITEKEKSFLNDFYYLNFRQSHLGLWLQKNTATSGSPIWEPSTTSGEPHILFTLVNRSGINYFALETDGQLRTSTTLKPSRPNRYEHPGYTNNPPFRIAKWSLFYPTPANVIIGLGGVRFEDDLTNLTSGINGFRLLVTFEHVDHLRKRKNIAST